MVHAIHPKLLYSSGKRWNCPIRYGVLSQTVTLTGIALIDNNGVRRVDAFVGSGRLLATLTTSTAGASTESTVCGPLDIFFPVQSAGIYINSEYSRLCVRH